MDFILSNLRESLVSEQLVSIPGWISWIIVFVPALQLWDHYILHQYLLWLLRYPRLLAILTISLFWLFAVTLGAISLRISVKGSDVLYGFTVILAKWFLLAGCAWMLISPFYLIPASYKSQRRASRLGSLEESRNIMNRPPVMAIWFLWLYRVLSIVVQLWIAFQLLCVYYLNGGSESQVEILESVFFAIAYWTVYQISMLYFSNNAAKDEAFMIRDVEGDTANSYSASEYLQEVLLIYTKSPSCEDVHSWITRCSLCHVVHLHETRIYSMIYGFSLSILCVGVTAGWLFLLVTSLRSGKSTEFILAETGISIAALSYSIIHMICAWRVYRNKRQTSSKDSPKRSERLKKRFGGLVSNTGDSADALQVQKTQNLETDYSSGEEQDSKLRNSSTKSGVERVNDVEMRALGKADSVLTIAGDSKDYVYAEPRRFGMKPSVKAPAYGIKKTLASMSVATLVPSSHLTQPSDNILRKSPVDTTENVKAVQEQGKIPFSASGYLDFVESYNDTLSSSRQGSLTEKGILKERQSSNTSDSTQLHTPKKRPSSSLGNNVTFANSTLEPDSTKSVVESSAEEIGELNRLTEVLRQSLPDPSILVPVNSSATLKRETSPHAASPSTANRKSAAYQTSAHQRPVSPLTQSMLADASILTPKMIHTVLNWLESPEMLFVTKPLMDPFSKDIAVTVPMMLQKLHPLFKLKHPSLFLHLRRAILNKLGTTTIKRKSSLLAYLPQRFDADTCHMYGDKNAVHLFKETVKEILKQDVDEKDFNFSNTFDTQEDVKKCLFLLLRCYVRT